jgi:hypothetical protein
MTTICMNRNPTGQPPGDTIAQSWPISEIR